MQEFLNSCRYFFGYAFFFSMFVNVLQLTFSIYMLQVYDRVLTSYSIPTLVVITIAAFIALSALTLLEWIRSRLLVRAGVEIDRQLSPPVLRGTLNHAVMPLEKNDNATLRDVQLLRTFLSGSSVFAFFDIPWMPLYFLLIFVLHPALGAVAVCGGMTVIALGVLTDRVTRKQLEQASALNQQSATFALSAARNAASVKAMGMLGYVSLRWETANKQVIALQTGASHSAAFLHAFSKSLRISLQVLIYAVGAYLAVIGNSTPGIMIAASIIMGRALAPIDQAIATYRQSQEAKSAYIRLKNTLNKPVPPPPMPLPVPQGNVSAQGLYFVIQGHTIIHDVTFQIPAGRVVAIIGPSASGKSTLCKMLLGLWPSTAGKVRLDGADIGSWDSDALGGHIGYLSQEAELFRGSVAENIARMGEVDSEKVIHAAQAAGTHNLILALPKGYDTEIGEGGASLSGGQRQRIGLARALYGQPSLIVLDEPNSNLDEAGDASLVEAIRGLQQRQATTILVTHKPAILSIADDIMMMQNGKIAIYGRRDAVLAKMASMNQQRQSERQRQIQAGKRSAILANL
jgi:PrtD family type I secretion system ABC transporter